jgi:hypothetical protein
VTEREDTIVDRAAVEERGSDPGEVGVDDRLEEAGGDRR